MRAAWFYHIVFAMNIFIGAASAAPAAVSEIPAAVTIDFAEERGPFSRELFGDMDSPFVDREAYRLLKEADFALVANMVRDMNPAKAEAIADFGFETLFFFEHNNPQPAVEIEREAQQFLERAEEFKKAFPGFDVGSVIFGNEPDLSPPPGGFPAAMSPFWNGSMEELFRDYEVFAKYVKSRRPDIMIGGLGFASAGSRVWIERFIEYVERHHVPLDFLPYHCYCSAVRPYSAGVFEIKEMLRQHPGLNPRLAVTELDIRALPIPTDRPYPEMDTAWKAAHNVLAMLALAENGVWMAIDYGGPSRDPDGKVAFLWIRADGTKKPVFFAHHAFNQLRDTVRLAQEGSNFETFGVAAGKSNDNNAVTVVVASYDQYSLLPRMTAPYPDPPPMEMQSPNAKVYKEYSLTLKNLPWEESDILTVQRYLVDDTHTLTLAESREIRGAPRLTFEYEIALPQVQLLKISCKK